MRALIATAAAVLLVASGAWGQSQQPSAIPEQSLHELSTDLATIQQNIMKAWQAEQRAQPEFTTGWYSPGKVQVTAPKAPVMSGAAPDSKTLAYVDIGSKLTTTDKVGSYYAVSNPQGGEWANGWISAGDVVPTDSGGGSSLIPSVSDIASQLFDSLTQQLDALKAKYDSNKYVRVTGFSITLGIPPSATVNFVFK